MSKSTRKLRAIFAGLLLGAGAGLAQDSGPLIDALIKKGILTNQEAEDVRADLMKESQQVPSLAYAGGKSTNMISVGGRLQIQYAGLNTEIDGKPDPAVANTNHFFLRRVYLTTKASMGPDWSMALTYDFAGSSYDAAYIEWKHVPDIAVDVGLRKVNVGYEEFTSSGSLKAIERSGATRYFVEANNGRRLGAASYRVGLFLEGNPTAFAGKGNGFYYGLALTNPERDETFDNASNVAANTKVAYWAHAGYFAIANGLTYRFGAGAGYLNGQGGLTLNKGDNLKVYSVYADVTSGKFNFAGEYLQAKVDHGVSATTDASPKGFWLQPSYMFTDKLEGVFRYSYLDSDSRGVAISDGVRSAVSGGTMNKLTELYAGGNWYFVGNDTKLQVGYVYGESKDTVTGTSAKAKAHGLRTQLQVNY